MSEKSLSLTQIERYLEITESLNATVKTFKKKFNTFKLLKEFNFMILFANFIALIYAKELLLLSLPLLTIICTILLFFYHIIYSKNGLQNRLLSEFKKVNDNKEFIYTLAMLSQYYDNLEDADDYRLQLFEFFQKMKENQPELLEKYLDFFIEQHDFITEQHEILIDEEKIKYIENIENQTANPDESFLLEKNSNFKEKEFNFLRTP